MKAGVATRFALNDQVNFIATFQNKLQDSDLRRMGQFRTQDTEFNLLTFISF